MPAATLADIKLSNAARNATTSPGPTSDPTPARLGSTGIGRPAGIAPIRATSNPPTVVVRVTATTAIRLAGTARCTLVRVAVRNIASIDSDSAAQCGCSANSAAGASLFLSFLPILPSQILLNNLLYDSSQLAIPTDNVDEEQLRRPSHWDIKFIRRFMIYFGPLSSVFAFITFAVMLWVFHSGPAQFRSGWFVESLATQTLVIFAIRTRRTPFFRSHPSLPLTLAAISVVIVGAVLPATPLAHTLGFQPLPGGFFAAVSGMVVGYLALIEIGKKIFYRTTNTNPKTRRLYNNKRHQQRRAAQFSSADQ